MKRFLIPLLLVTLSVPAVAANFSSAPLTNTMKTNDLIVVSVYNGTINGVPIYSSREVTALDFVANIITYGNFPGGGSFVNKFNNRSGNVTLGSGDVTGALGYTPLDAAGGPFATVAFVGVTSNALWQMIQGNTAGVFSFNGRQGVVTLVSADVTGALGYTPFSLASAGTAAYSNSTAFVLSTNGFATNLQVWGTFKAPTEGIGVYFNKLIFTNAFNMVDASYPTMINTFSASQGSISISLPNATNYLYLPQNVQVASGGNVQFAGFGLGVVHADASGNLTSSTVTENDITLVDVTKDNVGIGAHGFAPKGSTYTGQFWRSDWTLGIPDTATYVTGNGGVLTNAVQATNVVVWSGVLTSSGNATNYTVPLWPGPSGNMLTIYTGNTNVYVQFTGTNVADAQRTVRLAGWTNSVNVTIGFIAGQVATNANFNFTLTNGFSKILNFYNLDATGTNVLVSDAGRYGRY